MENKELYIYIWKMEGLDFIIITLVALYFLGILFTFLLIGRLTHHHKGGWSFLVLTIISMVLTVILFWTNLYLNISFQALLLYFILVAAAYTVHVLFVQQENTIPDSSEPGAE